MLKTSRIFTLLIVALLASCSPKVESPDLKKPDVNDPGSGGGGGGTTDKKALLTAHSWVLYDYTSISSDPATIPNRTWADLPQCERDDILTFSANGQFTLDEGAEKCNPADDQISDSGPWSLNQPGTIITMNTEEVKVIKLESGDMILEYNTDFFGLFSLKETKSYRKF